ncbi:MAG TPA: hypothetical protein VLC10_05035 [Patescibacteria group bacterium]|nr:hypothetical protein [Patescibacteria group bacterium]
MNPTGRRILLSSAAAVAALFATAVLAAGTGSGSTSVPTTQPKCDRDVWDCTEWGACAGGARTRVCTLATDCPGTETPKPADSERCETGAAGCQADTWVCEDWAACDARGNQHRDCRLTVDCAGVQTVKPTADRPCPSLQCGDLPSIRERIACRLKLEPAGIAREDEISYLPELCRVTADESAKAACIALYRSFAPCWSSPAGDERTNCAKAAIGLAGDLKERVIACKEMDDPAKTECLEVLRKKVYDLILFRIYDLEDRAEALRANGVPDDVVVTLSVKVEEAKAAFRAATDKDGRRKAILDARDAWKAFLAAAKPYLR